MAMNNVGLATVGAAQFKNSRRGRPIAAAVMPQTRPSRIAPGSDAWQLRNNAAFVRPPAEVLQLLACFKEGADMAALTSLAPRCTDVKRDLDAALRNGLISASATSTSSAHYRFVHEELRQQLYHRIPPRQRALLHLKIGRQLLGHTPPHVLSGQLFAVLDQLNLGSSAMPMGLERARCARLNLQAAERACAGADLICALRYCDAGLAALDDNVWPIENSVRFALTRRQAFCMSLLGHHEQPETFLFESDWRFAGAAARSDVSGVKEIAVRNRANLQQLMARPDRACRLAKLWELVPKGVYDTAELLGLPKLDAPELRNRLSAMADVLKPALRKNISLALTILEKILPVSVCQGHNEATPLAYMALAICSAREPGRASAALTLGKSALALANLQGFDGYAGATRIMAGTLLLPWLGPLSDARSVLTETRNHAADEGDLVIEMQARDALFALSLWCGDPLKDIETASEKIERSFASAATDLEMAAAGGRLALVRALRNACEEPTLPQIDTATSYANLVPQFHANVFLLYFLSGDHAAILQAGTTVSAADSLTSPGLEHAAFEFFSGLAHAKAHAHESDAADAQSHLNALKSHRRALLAMAQYWPVNFAAMNSLLAAESARLQSHDSLAMQAYEQAIEAASAQGQLHILAITHELAGLFYEKLNLATASRAHLWQAQRTYEQWGAHGKARHLCVRRGASDLADTEIPATAPESDNALNSDEPATAGPASPFAHFTASIAHEVNQPIAAMMFNAGAALNWLKRESPDLEQVRNSLQIIVASGKRAGEIIHSMRRLAQHTAPEMAPVLIDDAIRDVLGLMRTEFQQQGILVETQFGLERHSIRADRCQLQQVLMNLLINAVDAMAGVCGRPHLLKVKSQLALGGANLLISVEDNGVGIAPDQAPQIFEALVSSKPDGMGMGLAICRAVIDAHGGQIWCQADLAHGAAFHIRLPALMVS